jgi:hypothetical protein
MNADGSHSHVRLPWALPFHPSSVVGLDRLVGEAASVVVAEDVCQLDGHALSVSGPWNVYMGEK